MADYHAVDPYDDTQLAAMIDQVGLNRSAERLWNESAAALAKLVNVAESGSSRSLGDAYKNAIGMSSHYRKMAESDDVPVDTSRFARTRAIVREG